MAAPVPATMRFTDGRPAKADAPTVMSHAFQLTTKEPRAVSDVVGGMCFIFPICY